MIWKMIGMVVSRRTPAIGLGGSSLARDMGTARDGMEHGGGMLVFASRHWYKTVCTYY